MNTFNKSLVLSALLIVFPLTIPSAYAVTGQEVLDRTGMGGYGKLYQKFSDPKAQEAIKQGAAKSGQQRVEQAKQWGGAVSDSNRSVGDRIRIFFTGK